MINSEFAAVFLLAYFSALKKEAVFPLETSVKIQQTTRRHTRERNTLQRRGNVRTRGKRIYVERTANGQMSVSLHCVGGGRGGVPGRHFSVTSRTNTPLPFFDACSKTDTFPTSIVFVYSN
jgi:hypothetical protein